MARPWSSEEDVVLEACAADGLSGCETARALCRSANTVYARAGRRQIRFASAAQASPRAFLAKGGVLVREDVGGAVGIAWSRAHRSGPGFASTACERYLQLGLLKPLDDAGRLFGRVEAP